MNYYRKFLLATRKWTPFGRAGEFPSSEVGNVDDDYGKDGEDDDEEEGGMVEMTNSDNSDDGSGVNGGDNEWTEYNFSEFIFPS
jgi:hypothetical protein